MIMFLLTLTFAQWHSGELGLWRVLLWSVHLVPPSALLLPLSGHSSFICICRTAVLPAPHKASITTFTLLLWSPVPSLPPSALGKHLFFTQHSILALKSSSTNNFQGHPSKRLINNHCASPDFICVVSSLSPTPNTACLSYDGDLIMSRNCGFASLSLECFISRVHA